MTAPGPGTAGRIKIVQVVNSLARAGAERATAELATGLDPAEFEAHVLVVRDGPLRHELQAAGVPVHVTSGDFDARSPAVLSRMTRVLRQLAPDLVNTHLTGSDIVGGIAARRAGVRAIVSTQHDLYRRSWPFGMFRRYSARWLDAVVAVSDEAAKYCMRYRHVDAERVHVIENAVSRERFADSRPSLRPPGAPVTFGAVGTLIPVKGHSHLVEAFATVRRSVPDAHLVIAGTGPERERLLRLAEQAGCGEALVLRGLVEDIPSLLGELDVFVHPSLQEGLPIALLEAMAAGRPVIASDLPAIRHVLDEGRAGVLVPPADPEALAQAMIDLANDPPRADALAEAARRRVSERYSVERMVAEYAALYKELVRNAG